jgi:hypothetical protein
MHISSDFWGPVANWGLVGAAVYDSTFKGPEIIDIPMTATMIGYSSLFIRFAWMVQPRNYILFACHAFNVTAQLNQMRRAIEYKIANVPDAAKEMTEFAQKAALIGVGLVGLIASSGRIQKGLVNKSMPEVVQKIAAHPAGPMTIFFWAPTSKWLLSVNNLVDLNKPTDKMSLAQQTALTATGCIWTRYAMVINPINYNLAIVNLTLGMSSGYHLMRKIKADYM